MKLITRIKKTLSILILGILSAIMLTACGNQSKAEAKEKVNETLQKGFLEAGATTDSYFGKITATHGSTITIALAEDVGMGGPVQEGNPQEGSPSENNTPKGNPPEGNPPEGQESIPQDKPDDKNNSEKAISLTGEEVTITIDQETIFKEENAEITYEDLAVGDVISASMSGEKVLTVTKGINKRINGINGKDAGNMVSENQPLS